jgi:hypothetical protein
VYDAKQHLLGEGAAGESLTLTLAKGQRYALKVSSSSGMTGAYDLGIAKVAAQSSGTTQAILTTLSREKGKRHDFDDNA